MIKKLMTGCGVVWMLLENLMLFKSVSYVSNHYVKIRHEKKL